LVWWGGKIGVVGGKMVWRGEVVLYAKYTVMIMSLANKT
jgi:hypothetical protein